MFEQERRRAEVDRHRENSARLAQAFQKFETTGQGSIEFEKRVDFKLTFIEEPYITYGCQIDIDELSDLLDVDANETPALPQCSGFVTHWDQDEHDFYTGAWVAIAVNYPTASGVPADAKVHSEHHFTFTGIALKDVPLDVRH